MMSDVGATRNPSFDGDLAKAARERKGWSQGRLAAELEVTVQAIGAWERGARTPSPPLFVKLAEVLGGTTEDFMTLPRAQWSLVDFRTAVGLHQLEVVKVVEVDKQRLSHIESAYERGPEELFVALADLYKATPQELKDSWDRTRQRLMEEGQ